MKLANEDVSLLAFTSEQIIAPFLLPEMVGSILLIREKYMLTFGEHFLNVILS